MKIKLSSILVGDQEHALQFYTRKLGFEKKTDIPMGEVRWLTVVSPEAPDEVELVLEPNLNPAAMAFQQAMYDGGIPQTAFQVDDIKAEYEQLQERGVEFRSPPTAAGPVTLAILDDSCGNWIQIYQV